ncbi:MAG: metal ABC transporter ATP-binding protein [Bradymonadaceae bacterium]|nr:metal ABC transporter ATP-binding protein [Lujinxingiaceae bacterium]
MSIELAGQFPLSAKPFALREPSGPPALIVRDLVCGYGNRPLLGPISFTVDRGCFLLIEGPNGAGKSTLVKTLIGLLAAVSGGYSWGVEREHLRFVPQTRTLDPMLPATVHDVLATGLHRGRGWRALRIRDDGAQIERALALVEMGEFSRKLFRELSEGQKQLVLLARALLGEPAIVLLDEPSASMDPEREAQTIALLQKLRHEHAMTVLMIAHGSPLAREASDRIMTLDRDGQVHIGATSCASCETH